MKKDLCSEVRAASANRMHSAALLRNWSKLGKSASISIHIGREPVHTKTLRVQRLHGCAGARRWRRQARGDVSRRDGCFFQQPERYAERYAITLLNRTIIAPNTTKYVSISGRIFTPLLTGCSSRFTSSLTASPAYPTSFCSPTIGGTLSFAGAFPATRGSAAKREPASFFATAISWASFLDWDSHSAT
jgi:hypothetical protein